MGNLPANIPANIPAVRILAVLFDYGQVLSAPPDPAARQRMESLLGAAPESFHAAYWRYREAYDRGTLSGKAYWQAVAGELGRTPDAQTLTALLHADVDLWTLPNTPMIEWAALQQRSGLRTGILSNLGDAMETGVRERMPWLRDFDHLTFSHRLGITKPDPAIYRHAAAGLGVQPADVLFLDDREDNVQGALAEGMLALPYREHAAFLSAVQQLGLKV